MREVEGVYAHWTAEDWERLRLMREQEERDLQAQIAEDHRVEAWLHQRAQQRAQAEREEAGRGC